MDLTYSDDYWDNPESKRAFLDFLIRIHNLDLSLWDRMGYWDNKYRPFSFFDGNTVVASTCLYSMDMTIRGERRLVAQISSVGTLPGYRRRGLNLELTRKALKWAEATHDFFFLFADEDAFGFYKRCGFRRTFEHKTRLHILGRTARAGAAKMDVQKKEHLDLIYRCASEREPVCDMLGVYNERLLMFWCLYFLTDNISYIADLDLLILYERKDGIVTVFDIVGKKLPPFSEVYSYIGSAEDTAVEFMFMPDKLGLQESEQVLLEIDNGTHLLGDFPFEGSKFILPYTAHA